MLVLSIKDVCEQNSGSPGVGFPKPRREYHALRHYTNDTSARTETARGSLAALLGSLRALGGTGAGGCLGSKKVDFLLCFTVFEAATDHFAAEWRR